MTRDPASGSRVPTAFQTLAWMLRPPLAMLENGQHRFGDVFRLSIYGPRYPDEPGFGPLTRREVTVFSRPELVDEIFR